jgi:hypothetical protein
MSYYDGKYIYSTTEAFNHIESKSTDLNKYLNKPPKFYRIKKASERGINIRNICSKYPIIESLYDYNRYNLTKIQNEYFANQTKYFSGDEIMKRFNVRSIVLNNIDNIKLNGNFDSYHMEHVLGTKYEIIKSESNSKQYNVFLNINLRPSMTYYFKAKIILSKSVIHERLQIEDSYNRALINISDANDVKHFNNIYSKVDETFKEYITKTKTKTYNSATDPILDLSTTFNTDSKFYNYLKTLNGLILKVKNPISKNIELVPNTDVLIGLKINVYQTKTQYGIVLLVDAVY